MTKHLSIFRHRKFWTRVSILAGLLIVGWIVYLAYHYEPADTRVETHHVAP